MTADPPNIPAGPIDTEPIGFRPSREQEAILRDLLAAAGVELGAYDERIATWLAGWDWSTVAVIASWIQRAATAER
jgi:cell division protein YceG involved in septum cleavage